MPATPHIEEHFTGSATVREIVIGMADGLTVPFALAAGLSAAVSSTSVIVTAGFAEIAAGAMAMGLGGYLAGKTDAEHYQAELAREQAEIDGHREHEVREVEEILRGFGLEGAGLQAAVEFVTSDRQRFIDFLMRFELDLKKPDPKHAPISAFTIGTSYIAGWPGATFPLPVDERPGHGAEAFGRHDGRCAVRFRRGEGAFHRSEQVQVRAANASGWRSRGWCRLCARARLRLGGTRLRPCRVLVDIFFLRIMQPDQRFEGFDRPVAHRESDNGRCRLAEAARQGGSEASRGAEFHDGRGS